MTRRVQNKTNNNFIIESIDPKTISENDLEKIAEIEQDMWAREDWIGEYIKCTCCNKIHSKEDVYLHITNDLKIQTVAKIEEALQIIKIPCISCHSKTEYIYDRNEYIEEIRDRYSNSVESFLTVLRDKNWEIRGFEDWYIDRFDRIYKNEFSLYYNNIWTTLIKKKVEEIIKMDLPNDILMCSSVWMEQKYANFYNLYNIMKHFFWNIYNKKWKDLLWLYEAVVWWVPYSIYHIAWVERLWIPESDLYSKVENISSNYKSDIFVHSNVAWSFSNALKPEVKEFIRSNRKIMKEIRN